MSEENVSLLVVGDHLYSTALFLTRFQPKFNDHKPLKPLTQMGAEQSSAHHSYVSPNHLAALN